MHRRLFETSHRNCEVRAFNIVNVIMFDMWLLELHRQFWTPTLSLFFRPKLFLNGFGLFATRSMVLFILGI